MVHINKPWIILIAAFFSLSANCFASEILSVYSDSIPTYTETELETRFGKKAAQNIQHSKNEHGYSHAMVFLP